MYLINIIILYVKVPDLLIDLFLEKYCYENYKLN